MKYKNCLCGLFGGLIWFTGITSNILDFESDKNWVANEIKSPINSEIYKDDLLDYLGENAGKMYDNMLIPFSYPFVKDSHPEKQIKVDYRKYFSC